MDELLLQEFKSNYSVYQTDCLNNSEETHLQTNEPPSKELTPREQQLWLTPTPDGTPIPRRSVPRRPTLQPIPLPGGPRVPTRPARIPTSLRQHQLGERRETNKEYYVVPTSLERSEIKPKNK